MKKTLKIIISLLIVLALLAFIYWLWQRQPKDVSEPSQKPGPQNQIVATKQEDITISTEPEDGKILEGADTTLTIKTAPSTYVAIISNSFTHVAKTDAAGLLQQDEKLESGLNLVQISVFTTDFSKRVDKKIALWLKGPKNTTSAKLVLAGLVKNIFQNVITLSTDTGEKKVNQDKVTKVNYPSPPPGTTKSKNNQNIRVGDYLVVLGNPTSGDEIAAQSIDIFRDNKPQIGKDIQIVKLISNVKNNLFSAKVEKDNQIIEFTVDKDTQIFKDDRSAKNDEIKKDKKSIIIYHMVEDQKVADLVYILP